MAHAIAGELGCSKVGGMVDSASHTLAAATDQRRKRDALDKARANYVSSITLMKSSLELVAAL